MGQPASVFRLSPQDYLEGEKNAEVRHEYVNGKAFAMAGASKVHNLITGALYRLLGEALRHGPCRVYMESVKVRVQTPHDQRFYYPDLHVECAPASADTYVSERPTLIVEVLSETTERTDRADKFYAYRRLESLQEYVLVAQDEARVEVYRRITGWELEVYHAAERFRLDSVGAEFSVAAVYADVAWPGPGLPSGVTPG